MITMETEAADLRLKDFISKARAFQKKEGMTCRTFAKYCDIGDGTWINVCNRMFKTNVYTVIKISNATGISI